MAKPFIMSVATWKSRTGKFGHGRSNELKAIDTWLAMYHSPAGKPAELEILDGMLAAWKAKKLGGTMSRDHNSAVTDLTTQIAAALALGHATEWNGSYPRIYIAKDQSRGNAWVSDGFRGDVKAALSMIASKPIGRQLLVDVSNACGVPHRKVVIEYSAAGSSAAPMSNAGRSERKKIQKVGPNSPSLNAQALLGAPELVAKLGAKVDGAPRAVIPNVGASAVVTWNPDDNGIDGRPSFIALAHELIHALHYVTGTCYRSATGMVSDLGNAGIMEEEMRTVGFGAYAGEVPSENAIRGEHGVALRADYVSTIRFDNVTHTLLS